MISGGGFKPSALNYAASEGVLVSRGQDMQELAELLGSVWEVAGAARASW